MYTISTLFLIYYISNICHIALILAKNNTENRSFYQIAQKILEIASVINWAVKVYIIMEILWKEYYAIGENLEDIIERENDD